MSRVYLLLTVLMITSSFPGDENDGQGIIIARLAESLVELNQRVIILAPHSYGIPYRYNHRNVLVYRFPYFLPLNYEILAKSPGMLFHLSTNIGKIQLPLLIFSELIASLLICRKERISIINTHWILPHGIIGVICGFLFSIPHICSVHGTDVTITRQYPILSPVIRHIARWCDQITVNSRYTRDILMSCCKDQPPPIIIPMGVDNTLAVSIGGDSSFPKDMEKPLILYVGRLIKWKGVHILIQAMKQVTSIIPGASLVIVGDGVCMSRLKCLVKELNLESRVEFAGRVSNKVLITWYQKASVFVLPSISVDGQTEGLGVVLLEAMKAGVPVIGSKIGGIPDIINDGVNGFLVPPEDPVVLSDRIIWLLENYEIRRNIARAGLETVKEKFGWENIGRQFVEVYDQIP